MLLKPIRTAVVVGAVVVLCLVGCGSGDTKVSDSGDDHGHGDHAQGDHPETSHHGGSAREGGGHHHDEAHMKHMAETRERLRKELGAKYNDPVPPATPEQMALGRQVYQTFCLICHGHEGKGNGPGSEALKTKPADFTDFAHATYYSDQGRLHVIRNGVPESPMVGWAAAIGEEKVMAVHAFVRSLREEK